MNEDEFIIETEAVHSEPESVALTGWESIRFQVEDEPPSDSLTAAAAP